MGKREKTGATPALRALSAAGIEHVTHTYESAGSDFGAEAAAVMAERLGTAPDRILKTLVVALSGHSAPGPLGVAMVPVDAHLDLKAVAAALGASKASMADPAEAQRATGYVLGGVSPLGQKRRLPTVVDASAESAGAAGATVFFSGGRRGLEIEMDPADLVRFLDARVAAIAAR